MTERSSEDSVAFALVMVVGIFVVGSLLALIVAAFMGQPGGEGIWSGLFAIVTACLGALGGYLGGKEVATRQLKNGKSAPPPGV